MERDVRRTTNSVCAVTQIVASSFLRSHVRQLKWHAGITAWLDNEHMLKTHIHSHSRLTWLCCNIPPHSSLEPWEILFSNPMVFVSYRDMKVCCPKTVLIRQIFVFIKYENCRKILNGPLRCVNFGVHPIVTSENVKTVFHVPAKCCLTLHRECFIIVFIVSMYGTATTQSLI